MNPRTTKVLIGGFVDDHLSGLVAAFCQEAVPFHPLQFLRARHPDEVMDHATRAALTIIFLNPRLVGQEGASHHAANDLEFISHVKQRSDLPVIIVHNKRAGYSEEALLHAGANRVFTLPFDGIEFMEAVSAVLPRTSSPVEADSRQSTPVNKEAAECRDGLLPSVLQQKGPDGECSLNCSECGESNTFPITYGFNAWRDAELMKALFAGELNIYRCRRCGHEALVDVPLRVSAESVQLQYVPKSIANERYVLEQILEDQEAMLRTEYVFSLEEMIERLRLMQRLADYVVEKQREFRRFTVPEAVMQRNRSRYKKSKVKVIAYCATFFRDGAKYSAEEVKEILGRALRNIPPNPFIEATHILAALCELGLLMRTRDGRTYWKLEENF